jgi:hypothetical protein
LFGIPQNRKLDTILRYTHTNESFELLPQKLGLPKDLMATMVVDSSLFPSCGTTTTTTTTCENSIDDAECELLSASCTDEIVERREYMAINCLKTCNLCTTTCVNAFGDAECAQGSVADCLNTVGMTKWCRKFCNLCTATATTTTTPTTTTTTTTTTTPTTTTTTTTTAPTSTTCENASGDESCEAAKANGNCTTPPYAQWMALNCIKTCNLCTSATRTGADGGVNQ